MYYSILCNVQYTAFTVSMCIKEFLDFVLLLWKKIILQNILLQSPSRASSSFTLEPGDLLMDFTEATPMIKTYPADPSNSFFDPYATVQEYPVDLLDTPLQQYSAEPSPKRHSPAIHMVTPRQLMNQVQTMQTTQSLRTSKADSSEGLRRELEREKMMKRLLMTEL
ncbi:band 4.1-like protein 4B isoform X1 [Dendrobates tinctorius]|uniref:band 4.1-like protein 4B isoform X1 n=1 Tax=Dendrobates tinctorius TaxID=92724 RepID=UPI003CCA69E4